MKIKTILTATLLIVFIIFLITGCNEKVELKGDEAARVNGKSITRSRVTAYVAQLAALDKQADIPKGEEAEKLEKKAVHDLIWEELLVQQAEKRGIKVSSAEVHARLSTIKDSSFDGDDKKFEKFLKNQSLTVKKAQERLRRAMLVEKLQQKILEKEIKIKDSDVQNYYKNNAALLKEPERRHLRHMLFNTKEAALEAKSKLENGADPVVLAKEVSLDINTNQKGGDLGWLAKGVTSPPFDEVAFSLRPGVWSDPVETPSGWNIVKVEEIKREGVPPLNEVEEKIRKLLLRERSGRAWSDWLKSIREEAQIVCIEKYRDWDTASVLPPNHP